MSGKKRRSFEPGHRPKFLVIVDSSEECSRAVRFAARRARHINAGLVMLSVLDPSEFQQWLGVGNLIRAEAEQEAQGLQDVFGADVRLLAGIDPERVIRTGSKAAEIIKLIDEDEDISFLVLAAGTGKEGPGPLVSQLAGKASAAFAIPVVVVPGALSDEEIDALA